MSKNLYFRVAFVTLRQKAPSDVNAKLYVGTVKTDTDKYDSFVVGYGDPGEPRLYDTFDYPEFKVVAATFTKPSNYNETSQYVSEGSNGGSTINNFRLWSSVSVPDNFLIPSDIPTVGGVPTVSASNQTAAHGQSYDLGSMISGTAGYGSAVSGYQVWVDNGGVGVLKKGGVEQAKGQAVDVAPGQLNQVTFRSGSGTDSLWARASDGSQWGAWTHFYVTAPIDKAAVATPASANLAAQRGQTFAAGSLFSTSDGDGDAITKYQFWDSTAGDASGHFLLNGTVQGAGIAIEVLATLLASFSFQAGSGSDHLWVRAYDGYLWGEWKDFNVNAPVNYAPVAVAPDAIVVRGSNKPVAALFSVTDANGDAIVGYQFWDSTPGASSGHFEINGVAQGANVAIDVSAAQLAQTTFRAVSGSDDLWVRAYDGFAWGAWDSFKVTAPANVAPAVAAPDTSVAHAAVRSAAALFTASDAEGDAIVKYQFWDSTPTDSSGRFEINGVEQGANVAIDLTASQLAQTVFRSGSGSDDLWVRVFDGTDWSAWDPFRVTAPVDGAPTVAVGNKLAAHGAALSGASLFSASDPEGDALKFQFWDSTADAASGHFEINGVALDANVAIDVTASQLAQSVFQTGSGQDSLWVRAFDGMLWSDWKNFTVTAPVDGAPTVTVENKVVGHGAPLSGASLFSASDPEGDALKFQFWDSTADAASGHFEINGIAQGAGVAIDVAASQLAQTVFQSGSGQDSLWVRAFDGMLWSDWKNFTVTAPANGAPVALGVDTSATVGQTIAGSALVSATDPNSDAIVKYELWDSTASAASGHWVVSGAAQGSGVAIGITAAQLADTSFLVGSGTDTLWVRASDGMSWSEWDQFAVTGSGVANQAPVVTGSTVVSMARNASLPVTSLFMATDDHAITAYRFMDRTSDLISGHPSGYFTLGGVETASDFTVAASQLSSVLYVAGSQAGTDYLTVQAFDGTLWSNTLELHPVFV